MSLLPWANHFQQESGEQLDGLAACLVGSATGMPWNKGQKGARRQSSCWHQQGIPNLLNCGEKQTPLGRRSVCCSWAHTRAGMVMALFHVIPLPYTSLICKCSQVWPNMLRENINKEKKKQFWMSCQSQRNCAPMSITWKYSDAWNYSTGFGIIN